MKVAQKLCGLVLLFCSLVISPNAVSQQDGFGCRSGAADPEQDGYGWQQAYYGIWSSCIAGGNYQKPTIVNQQTGAQVDLIRAFWDPNADIANKTIRCTQHEFNATTGVYEQSADLVNQVPFAWLHNDTSYFHRSLPDQAPFQNTAFKKLAFDGELLNPEDEWAVRYLPYWSVQNGLYVGPSPLARSPYVELVNLDSDSSSAVRVWGRVELYGGNYGNYRTSTNDSDVYHLCYDNSGASFEPTGIPGVGGAPMVPIPDNLSVTLGDISALEEHPEIINKQTGQTVTLEQRAWNYNKDLANRILHCEDYVWDDRAAIYRDRLWLNDEDTSYTSYVFHAYNEGDYVLVSSRDFTLHSYWSTQRVSITDGVFDWDIAAGEYELIDNGVRIWAGDGSAFTMCSTNRGQSIGMSLAPSEMTNELNPTQPPDTVISPDDSAGSEESEAESSADNTAQLDSEPPNEITDNTDSESTTTLDSTSNQSNNEPETMANSGGGSFGAWWLLLFYVACSRRG